jgi:RecD/TraA family predicted helicase
LITKNERERILVRSAFQHIYPGEKITVLGSWRQNEQWGKYIEGTILKEHINEYWVAKWLKIRFQMDDDRIIHFLVDRKKDKELQSRVRELRQTRDRIRFLEETIDEKTITLIENAYYWGEKEPLWKDPFELLSFPGVKYSDVIQLKDRFKDQGEPSPSLLARHSLQKAWQQGHFFLTEKELSSIWKKKISIEHIEDPNLITVGERVYWKEAYEIEKKVAISIKQRLKTLTSTTCDKEIKNWEEKHRFTLAPQQKEAVNMAFQSRFSIITGGPGVGKTTVCRCIVDLLGKDTMILVAPTGRAAKRAQESTGIDASTIHAKLEYDGDSFRRNRLSPIDGRDLLADESSMIDVPLFEKLLEATPLETRIILVGDVDQLPSVGPGELLKNLIDSKLIPVTRLTEIFRQAADSPIIQFAYAVNQGKMPEIPPHEDLVLVKKNGETEVLKEVIHTAFDLYSRYSPLDVQVLIPMYDGDLGITQMNRVLQKKLHPNAARVTWGEAEFRQGDKVIQTRNDKERKVYNGDLGIVFSCKKEGIFVQFSHLKNPLYYPKEMSHDLQLAYAKTVHRSQGSEYKYVVIPLVESYHPMLQKNLLYTAATRAKEKLWLFYQLSALEKAVRIDSVLKRNTSLCEMLQEKNPIAS